MSAFSIAAIDELILPSKTLASMEDPSETMPPFSFHPPLYVTPPVEPWRPSSPSALLPSASPYVVNFKRRGPVQSAGNDNHADEGQQHDPSEIDQGAAEDTTNVCVLERNRNHGEAATDRRTPQRNLSLEFGIPGYAENKALASEASETAIETPMARDSRREEAIAIASDSLVLQPGTYDGSETRIKTATNLALSDGTKSATSLEGSLFTSPRASTYEEFFDAPDAPLDDSSSENEVSSPNLITRKLDKLVPFLQEEIARRIRAEETLALLQQRWNEMAKKCSLIGFSMTSSEEDTLDSRRENLQDLYEQFSEKLVVGRLVGGAIASAAVRAVKNEELESMLADKNREISRLWDKLHYVELVNREMSQRNQEAIEIAQRRKQRRRKRQNWALGCFCSALCLGSAGLLCYKLFPWDQAGTWTKSLNGSAKYEPISTELHSS
eukprot:c20904_g1_i1 orf=103-1422(+)